MNLILNNLSELENLVEKAYEMTKEVLTKKFCIERFDENFYFPLHSVGTLINDETIEYLSLYISVFAPIKECLLSIRTLKKHVINGQLKRSSTDHRIIHSEVNKFAKLIFHFEEQFSNANKSIETLLLSKGCKKSTEGDYQLSLEKLRFLSPVQLELLIPLKTVYSCILSIKNIVSQLSLDSLNLQIDLARKPYNLPTYDENDKYEEYIDFGKENEK